jgi:hypothetical protein
VPQHHLLATTTPKATMMLMLVMVAGYPSLSFLFHIFMLFISIPGV